MKNMLFGLSMMLPIFFDVDKSERVAFANLKPSTKTISLRLPEEMLMELKIIANRKDVPYQSLIKVFLKEKIEEESA